MVLLLTSLLAASPPSLLEASAVGFNLDHVSALVVLILHVVVDQV
jgi:hypothetical protein